MQTHSLCFRLGAQDAVVGIADNITRKPFLGLDDRPLVGKYSRPSYEKILELNPQAVFTYVKSYSDEDFAAKELFFCPGFQQLVDELLRCAESRQLTWYPYSPAILLHGLMKNCVLILEHVSKGVTFML